MTELEQQVAALSARLMKAQAKLDAIASLGVVYRLSASQSGFRSVLERAAYERVANDLEAILEAE